MFACTWIGWRPPIVKAAPYRLFEEIIYRQGAKGRGGGGGSCFFMWLGLAVSGP
jgi:hypothetical protein